MLDIIDTNLSTADTESLLAVMVSGVEEVRLGMDVTLDMEMLAQYDGKGECVKRLLLRGSVTLHLPTLMKYDGRGKCGTSAPDDGLGQGGRLGHEGFRGRASLWLDYVRSAHFTGRRLLLRQDLQQSNQNLHLNR